MDRMQLLVGLLVACGAFAPCIGEYVPCYNVPLAGFNGSTVISTLTYAPLEQPGWFPYYCWNFTANDGMQVEATCQYNFTRQSLGFLLAFYVDGILINYGEFLENQKLPEVFYSPHEILRLTVLSVRFDEEDVFACNVTQQPDGTKDVCGQSDFNVSLPVLFNRHISNNRIIDCLWYATSPNETYIYLDVVDIRLWNSQRLSFGMVVNGSLEEGVTLQNTQPNGTSYFFSGNSLWITFSSFFVFSDGAASLDFILRSEPLEGQCNIEQAKCPIDPKCIPLRALCDGLKDCSDYWDENNCDTCGLTNNIIRFGKTLTVIGGYHFITDGSFSTYSENSSSIPNTPTNSSSSVYTNGIVSRQSECIWRLTGPAGSRIRIEVSELIGHFFELKIGNGDDPSMALPNAVLFTSIAPSHPVEILSSDSDVWITLESTASEFYVDRLRIESTVYNVTECDDQIQCPSGLQCLNNASSVCDGRLECDAYEDELGCGECGVDHFMCDSGNCIPKYQLCNRKVDCLWDFADEFLCGSIEISANDAPRSLIQIDWGTACLWVITSDPGSKVQLELKELPRCYVNIGEGAVGAAETIWWIDSRPGLIPFPRVVSSNGSSLWIAKYRCLDVTYYKWYYPESTLLEIDVTSMDIRQYTVKTCAQGEFSCTSGPRCLPQSALCNGWGDCPEKEDEYGCGNCTAQQFSCRSGQGCTTKQRVCNGIHDCQDRSDEIDCRPCSDALVDISGNKTSIISTPNWPLPYPSIIHCQWLVVAEVGYRVVLTFVEFDMERGYDFLYIGNGLIEDPYVKLSGVQYPVTTASRHNEMFLVLKTDYKEQKKGFMIRVEQKQKVGCGVNEVACDMADLMCVQNDTSDRGLTLCYPELCGERFIYLQDEPYNLKSTWYPHNYPGNLDCQWSVFSSKKPTIVVEVMSFLTETSSDFLRIDDVSNGSQSFVLHGPTKVQSVFFNSGEVSISFTTDSTVEYPGFYLRLTNEFDLSNGSYCGSDQLLDCRDGSCVLDSAMCDGFIDCQGGKTDEETCESTACPMAYHCKNSSQCVLLSVVCNGRTDCPDGDDETECDKHCPKKCSCQYDADRNLRVNCMNGWDKRTLTRIAKITEALTLSGANISILNAGLFKGFSNLHALSLSDNEISTLLPQTFVDLGNLTFLIISKNQIASLTPDSFSELRNVETMIVRDIPLQFIERQAFRGLQKLQTLVLVRGGPSDVAVSVEDGALTDLVSLQKLYVDDYRLCCEFISILPNFLLPNCETTELQPPLNLCGSLMQNTFLRFSMWVLGLSALIGNALVIAWRWRRDGTEKNLNAEKKTHSMLVLNLAISDFMMGVYMLIIAGADLLLGDAYSRMANQWRSSVMCKVAGVLSVLSSEASVFIVTLISVDCFLGIVYPFSTWKLGSKSTGVAILIVWIVALGLSVGLTVFGSGAESDIYGLSDVCIGLPLITKPTDFEIKEGAVDNPFGNQTISIPVGTGQKPAWIFSIVLFLGVNLVCFLVVSFCYVAIFVKVRHTTKKVRVAAHRDREIKMAVKMALIVSTDFACWMPVIIMGILSQTGAVEIGPDMYAWIVVFILPINSSLNPYLYTIFTAVAAKRVKSPSDVKANSKSLSTLSSNVSERDHAQDKNNK